MSDTVKRDILERLEYVAGPWSDHTLAADAAKEIQRLRDAHNGILENLRMIIAGRDTVTGDMLNSVDNTRLIEQSIEAGEQALSPEVGDE